VFVVLKGPRRGMPLSADGLDEILEGARRRAGLSHGTCHELRHTCLTQLRKAGMSLEAVPAPAGHASIESTRIYLHLGDDWLASQYRRAAEAIDAQALAAATMPGRPVTGPALLPGWPQLAEVIPQVTVPMRRYLEQVACVLRPGSVSGADLALRSFAAFLAGASPPVTSLTSITRRHIEDYKPWLAARPGQNKPRLTPATIAHRLGTLRMFFVRIEEWGWDQAPARVPMFPGDLPRQDHPRPRAPDDAAAARLLRAARDDRRMLVRVTVEMLLRTGLFRRNLRRLGKPAADRAAAGARASAEDVRVRNRDGGV
jgi:site-specific recombinase XerD